MQHVCVQGRVYEKGLICQLLQLLLFGLLWQPLCYSLSHSLSLLRDLGCVEFEVHTVTHSYTLPHYVLKWLSLCFCFGHGCNHAQL
jgi:hypothetical protein